eukprot:jgi/Ulvmu1/6489/UM003_0121.1
MQAADALADQKTLHVLCTALRRPMHHALGLEMPAPLRGSTLACDVLPAGDADRFTPAWAAEVLTAVSEDLAMTLLRTSLTPTQHHLTPGPACSLRQHLAMRCPQELFCLPPALHPLVLRACFPCIDADHTLAIDVSDVGGDKHAVHPAAQCLPHFQILQHLLVAYPGLDDYMFAVNESKLRAVARAVGALPSLASLDVVAGQCAGFSSALATKLPEATALTSLLLAHAPPHGCALADVDKSCAAFAPVLASLPALQRLTLRNTLLPQLPAMLSTLRALRALHFASTPMPAAQAAALMHQAAALTGLTSVQFEESVTFVAVHIPGPSTHSSDASSDEDPAATSGRGSFAHLCSADAAHAVGDAVGSGDSSGGGSGGGAASDGSPPRTRVCLSSAGLPRALGGMTQLCRLSFVHGAAGVDSVRVPRTIAYIVSNHTQ